MSAMLEKAARAAEFEMTRVEMIDAAPSVIRAMTAKRIARAVLMAVRQPSEAILDSLGPLGHDAADAFPAVIDAILNEPE